jgi:hypothetical protein
MKNVKFLPLVMVSIICSIILPISPAQASTSAISESNYPYVAALARASILADQPVKTNTQKVIYQFEDGVPIENQNMIKEGVDNFVSHFGDILSYSPAPIGITAYSTLAGGLALAKSFDPNDSNFQADMQRTFANQVDPAKVPTVGMGGFSAGYKRFIVVEAPYFKTSDPNLPTYPADPVTTTHELAHEVQASINNGNNMRNPVWLCEGGAQVMGAALSVYQGKDYWAIGGRDQWSNRIPANRTVADLKIMEGETRLLSDPDRKLSEYSTGAALAEYLIAKGGFANSLLVNQLSYKAGGGMGAFGPAFLKVYGESLDDFYAEALPYVNYVSANWKTKYASSAAALAFITDRLGAAKAAETIAAAPKIAADALIAEAKAAADLLAKQNADAIADLLPRFQSEGCHAGSMLNATLQKLVGTTWVDVANARGWTFVSTCSAPTQYQPWTNADVEAGTSVRWHISATNAWDAYTTITIATGTSPEVLKAVADLKAKQNSSNSTAAADKAAADKAAADKAAADKAAAAKPKKSTLICVKGKLIKKITAVKPVCPKGYKKKTA